MKCRTQHPRKSGKPVVDAMLAVADVAVQGEHAYLSFEQDATDDAEKLKWRNCAAACKVVAMRIRKTIVKWGPEIGLGTIFCKQCNRPLTAPAKYDLCPDCWPLVEIAPHQKASDTRPRRKG